MVGRKRPPLPAPTESSVHDDSEEPTGSAATFIPDNSTDLSQRTDRSSYSIPEDGRPLTLPTKKIRTERSTGPTGLSETSLLIEYYEGDKSGQGPHTRPSVRVKVSPQARRLSREAGGVTVTEVRQSRQPSRTDRIPLDVSHETTSDIDQIEASELSARSPIEVELLNRSDMDSEVATKNVALPSDVSSMPPDSMLDGPPAIKVPTEDDSTPTSPEKPRDAEPRKKMVKATLKAPKIERTRSKSTERITQKAIEKLQREQGEEPAPSKTSKIRPKSGGSDSIAASDRIRSKRSSRSQRDSDLRSGTESSLLPNRDVESNISSGSKISINNPKLLATVEDAIRRLILPEIETIKRNQSVRSTRTRDSFISDDSLSRSGTNQRLSKATSEPYGKDKSGTDDNYGDYALGNSSRRRRHRTSGHGSVSSRQDSVDSIAREKERAKKHRPRLSSESNLTRENLRSQDSRSSVVSGDRERRRSRNRDRRESDSIAQTDDEYYEKQSTIPPMPMASEIQDSELTRDSLLSVETTESIDEEHANAIPQTARQVPIVKEVNRASPNTVESPISRTMIKSPTSKEGRSADATRPKDSRSLKSSRSDRSIGSNKKAAAYAAAGLSAAAAGLYAQSALADDKDSSSRVKRTTSKEKSRERSPRRAERKTSSESKPAHQKSPLSKESLSSSVDYPLTQKRHQGINLEREPEAMDPSRTSTQPEEQDGLDGDDSFYEKQRQLNDEYRSSVGYDSQRGSTDTNPWKGLTPGESPYKMEEIFNTMAGQQVRGVGANAQVVQTPMQAESAIASLAGDSVTSLHSRNHDQRSKDFSRHTQAQAGQESPARDQPDLHANTSAERWNAIRGHAQALSQGTLTMSDSGSVNDLNEQRSKDIHMSATGGPVAHPMPEAEYIYDDQSDLTDHRALDRQTPSVVEGRLGDEYENQGLWPYEPTPDIEKRRGGVVVPDGSDRSPDSVRGGAAVMGATGAGLGIGTATALALGAHGDKAPLSSAGIRSSAREDPYGQQRALDQSAFLDRQALDNKDEGYVTGDPGRSVGGETPLSFSKPPPKLFDERDQDYGSPQDLAEERLSTPRNRKHLSVNSHGIPAEGYDAATGTGMDHIESKDVVALMDHLTVRDGHRNARDTEILVTLVRSAAEMRDSFDEMKKFIETQNQATIKRSDQTTQSVLSKFMSEARSIPASARNMRSVSGLSEGDETPGKKQNIFKRALKGLGSRNEKDLSKMENMLMQLLGEVEALRASHNAATMPVPSLAQSRGLDSYERLRAAADSGYEPEGHAGTSTTTGMTATPSTQPRGQRMHSGYSYNRDSGNRPISTVEEGDEEVATYDNDNERMLTPTQENHRGLGVNYNTPPSAGKQFHSHFTPTTPKTGERRGRQQSTSSSMFGGIPKISRWSKTTTSSAAEGRPSFQNDRPYSEASRSGSEVNVLPGEQGTYEPHDDDRLRSANSLARDGEYDDVEPGRADTPVSEDEQSAEDPKYRANRHSLTLQHPQPRQGSAHRHPPHLEDQAQTYHHRNASRSSQGSQASSDSPQNDVFGSVPGLAKNRFSTATVDATSRRSSARNDGPLNPPKDQHEYFDDRTPGGGDYEDDQDSYDSLEDAHYRRTSGRTHGNDGAYESPSGGRYDDDYDSLDSDAEGEHLEYDEEDDDGGQYYPPPIPLERPRSPYSPGGLLEPIEERYSLEQSRISSPMSRRDTLNSKKTSRIEEEEEPLPERFGSPDLAPRPAVGAQGSPEGRRKITGPREMPHAQSASSGVARKPVAGN